MPNQIDYFSGININNDLLPADTAKDLYQIIESLGKYIDKLNSSVENALSDIKRHIEDHDNPHKLNLSSFTNKDLYTTLYSYYKTYFDPEKGTLVYDQESLMNIFKTYPLSLLECIRRISLNDLRVIDGLLSYNTATTKNIAKNYYTNDFNISEIGPVGFSSIPTYSFSRQWCGREFPYLYTLNSFRMNSQNIIIPKLKDYFEYNQNGETTDTDTSYGIPFGNKSMVSNDSMFISWDERYVYGDHRDSSYVLAITPYHKAIFFTITLDKGKYRIDVTVSNIVTNDFTIILSSSKTFSFYSDRAACVFTFNNDPIGFVSYLQDGFVIFDTIDVPFTYTGDYNAGRIYSGEIIDTDVIPTSAVDPDRVGMGSPSRTTSNTPLPDKPKLKCLDVTRFSQVTIGTGYVPNIRYISERLAQL